MKRVLQISLKVVFIFCFSVIVFGAMAQTGTITGTVTDEKGDGIIGASILLVGSTTGTVTDLTGNYSLDLPPGEVKISISYVGYLKEEATLTVASGQTTRYSAILKEDMLQLEDVVVIGYGSVKKSDLTGAVASVSSDELNTTVEGNITHSLEGRASGVRVVSATGAPGASTEVFIRGITSINGSGAMWVIDGVPGDPNSVNPADVESIEILKDAGTTAIYGASGGNGVVMVTTKKGQAGKTTATLSISKGWQTVPDHLYLDMASGPQYAAMYTEYQLMKRTRSDDIYFQDDFDSYETYDYQKEIFRTAPIEDYHLGISGGNEKSTFSIGLGYLNQEGVLRNTDYQKYTVRVNSDHKLNDWLTVGERVSVLSQKTGGFEQWEYYNDYGSPILQALQYQPFVPFYVDSLDNAASEKNENTNWSASPIGNVTNPISTIENLYKESNSNNASVSAYVKLTPIKGLEFMSQATGNITYSDAYTFTPTYNVSGSNRNLTSSIYKIFTKYTSWQLQNYATYSNSLFDVHNFSVMVGFEASEETSEWMSATRISLINEDEEMWYFDASLNDSALSQLPDGSGYEHSSYGYFGRFTYDYKGIVLAQFNLRRDSDSRFGPDNRHGIFPSYSLAFKFTELDPVRNALPFMNFGKIRWASGRVGSNTLDDYTFYSTVSTQQVYDYSFNNSSTSSVGAATVSQANSEIAWEAVITQNMGIDLGFLENRLTVTADWFTRYNEGMIMQDITPGHAGWIVRDDYQEGGSSDPYVNIGNMKNSGIESQIGWKDSWGDFSYSVDFNYTFVKTKAEEIPDTILSGEIAGIDGYLTKTVPNGALSEYYGYKVDRIFRPEDYDESLGVVTNQPYTEDPETGERIYAQPDAEPGDFKWVDRNDDGVIDEKDIGPIGNPVPKHVFGLTLNGGYKWFDLSIFLQGATGFKIFNAQRVFQYSTDGSWNWNADYVENHYRDDVTDRDGNLVFGANTEGTYPRIDLTNKNGNFTNISDFYMEDGSYLRIKNITFGVTAPSVWTEKIAVREFRAYFAIQNLYTFTKYNGFDPEIGAEESTLMGLDRGTYPKPLIYRVGINVTF